MRQLSRQAEARRACCSPKACRSTTPPTICKQLAEINDYLVPMVYDEHYQSGEPGPVASRDWFQHQIDQLAELAPPEKIVVGMGNYGYDWPIGGKGSAEVDFRRRLCLQAVSNHAAIAVGRGYRKSGAALPGRRTAARGLVSGCGDGVERSARASRMPAFAGVALWRLGAEDPDLWKVLASRERGRPAISIPSQLSDARPPQKSVN